MSKKFLLLAGICLAISPVVVSAQIVVDFRANPAVADFNGLTVAAPSSVSLDSDPGGQYNLGASAFGFDDDSTFTLLDAKYKDTLNNLQDSDVVNVSAIGASPGGLGVGGGPGSNVGAGSGNDSFFSGDQITFSLSGDEIILESFSFESLGEEEFFTLTSSAFDNLTATGLGSNVSYQDGVGSGTLTFRGTVAEDMTYQLSSLGNEFRFNNGPGTEITLAFGNDDPNINLGAPSTVFSYLGGFTFHANNFSAVPEPASMGLLAAAGIGFVVYRRRKKKAKTDVAA